MPMHVAVHLHEPLIIWLYNLTFHHKADTSLSSCLDPSANSAPWVVYDLCSFQECNSMQRLSHKHLKEDHTLELFKSKLWPPDTNTDDRNASDSILICSGKSTHQLLEYFAMTEAQGLTKDLSCIDETVECTINLDLFLSSISSWWLDEVFKTQDWWLKLRIKPHMEDCNLRQAAIYCILWRFNFWNWTRGLSSWGWKLLTRISMRFQPSPLIHPYLEYSVQHSMRVSQYNTYSAALSRITALSL